MYTYTSWVEAMANFLVIPNYASDTNFQNALPSFIDDAEQRLYRELDLLNTVFRDSSATFSTNTRTLSLPSATATFVVIQDINAITPAGTSNPDSGTRNPIVPGSRPQLDFTYPSSAGSTVPQYFAMVTQNQIVVGPWPDQAYQVEVVGTFRPIPLSAANPTTLLTLYFPDLWFSATQVIGAAYLKNWGTAADDPRMALTWESHVGTLLTSAKMEEDRKRFAAAGWSSQSANPQATPPRT